MRFWKTFRNVPMLLAAALLLACGAARAGELEGDVGASDNFIIVKNVRDDGRVMKDVPISVFDSQRRPVLEGKTDEKGEWVGLCAKAGKYEVLIGPDNAKKDRAGAPITIRHDLPQMPCCKGGWRSKPANSPNAAEAPKQFPWVPALLGFSFIGSSGLMFWIARPK